MDKKIQDYIHFYYGAECMVEIIDAEGVNWNPSTRALINPFTLQELHRKVFRNPKPILRPLSSMTEDERWQVQFDTQCWILEENTHPLDYVQPSIKNMADITNALRKMGFDCDELIESGLAIDKTKAKIIT